MTKSLADRAAAVRQAHINKTLHSELLQNPSASQSNGDAKGHSFDEELCPMRQHEAQVPPNVNDYATGKTLNTSLDGTKPTSSQEEHELFEWFLRLQKEQLPLTPFELSPGLKVTNRDVFYASLKRDVSAGADSARARSGALQHDLFMLRVLVIPNAIKTGTIPTQIAYQAWLNFYNTIRPHNCQTKGHYG